MNTRALLILLLFTLLLPQSRAQVTSTPTQPQERRVVFAVRIDDPIQVDGVLDESAWESAEPATDFIQRLPTFGLPATEETEVRLLYDEENLYVGVYCWDSAGRDGIVINDITRDFFTLDSDGFQIVLDTYDDNRNSFLFGTNPAAGMFDMQIGNDGAAGNTSWDGIWYVETQITDEGWQVEMAIPFRTLRFGRSEVQVWGVNFERRVRRKFEDSYWSPLGPQYRLGRVSLAGTLLGLDGLHHSQNLWITPYATAPVTDRENDDVDFQPDIGLDVKYGLTTQLTLDLTANTDFSQVEVDEEQINLTRFSLFFPEKRDFFLENAGTFEFGRVERRRPDLIPFFSRRIGLDEDGQVIPLWGGSRLTGRTGDYSLGLLSIQTREALAEPSTNYSVVRVRRDLFSQSDIGGLFVNKEASGPSFNRTYGADGNFTFFNFLDLSSYFLRTETPGLSDRDTASNFEASWNDQFFEIRAKHLRIGENFNPEVGFVPRTGIRKSSGAFQITPRPEEKISWIREINPSIELDYITDEEDLLETRVIEGGVSVTFSDAGFLRVEREFNFERLDEPFEIRDGQFIEIGDYGFDRTSIFYRSDRSRMISFESRLASGSFWDGDRDSYELGVTLQPNYRLSTGLSWGHNEIELPSGDFDTDLVAGRMVYSFSNRMFLNALIQYNSAADEVISNIRFNFIHRPLSDFFLVYNERRDSNGDILDRALIAKLTYLLAF